MRISEIQGWVHPVWEICSMCSRFFILGLFFVLFVVRGFCMLVFVQLDIYAEDSTFSLQTPISVLVTDAHTVHGCFVGFQWMHKEHLARAYS